jgi:DeoR/GlpR family transcriptional regulator of sugar metabolism
MTPDTKKTSSLPAERQKQILDYVLTNGSAVVKDLVNKFSVSEATVRRDLDELSRIGRIERTHGGAIPYGNNADFERFHKEKMIINMEEKLRIGEAAKAWIAEGDTVLLDSGTTTYAIARNLGDARHITLITNDIFIAYNAVVHPTSKVIVTGGIRMEDYYSLIGSVTEDFIRNIRVNKTFLGADGVHSSVGVTNSNFLEVGVKQLMLRAGERKILVADSDKFDKAALVRVFGVDELNAIITDSRLNQEQAEMYGSLTELKIV